MNKKVIIGFMMICASSSAMAYKEVANISAQEQADVMHELREGDFREAQQIIQYDEAIKNQIRRDEAMYDSARDMNRFNYGYSGW